MRYSRNDITDQVRQSGWESDVLEKMVRLALFLQMLDRHTFLHNKLLLKGGTALNLFHLDIPRLSVDIDLNYVGTPDPEEMTTQRPEIERAIAAVARSENYSVATSADAHAGRKFYFQYTNYSGMRDRLEVDLNFMFRIPLFPSERHPAKPLMPDLEVGFPLVSWPELVAGKCVAAVDRVAPRDLYDLAQLSSRLDLTYPATRAAWIGLSALLPHPLFAYKIDRFRHITRRQMDAGLRPFLRKGSDYDVDAILSTAEVLLEGLLTLTKEERLFITGIAEGHIESELLLPDDVAFCDHLRRHPALAWKILNVTEHLKRH